MRSSDVVAKLALTDEIRYLILEFVTIDCVMSHIVVIETIFVLVPLCYLLSYGERYLKWTCPSLA